MVTNYPQQLATAAEISYERTTGVMWRAIGRLSQLMCGMRGHDAVRHFEGKRVMMRCTSCGHDTPGWEISGRAPRKRFDGDARRHALKPQLVLRKTA
ncbi:hypothetical protein BH24ACI5_BH24ACI5_05280 [soil metagenome]